MAAEAIRELTEAMVGPEEAIRAELLDSAGAVVGEGTLRDGVGQLP